MLSGDKCLLNVYQMMAVHCLLFWENGDMYRGVVFPHLASGPVDPLWPSGVEASYPVFTSQGAEPDLRLHRRGSVPCLPEIRLRIAYFSEAP